MKSGKLNLIGAGGLALDIISCFRSEVNILGVWDDNLEVGSLFFDIPVIGKVSEIPFDSDVEFIISIGNPIIRKALFEKCAHLSFATLVHSTSARFALDTIKIGAGSILMPYSYVTGNVTIQDNVLLHIGAGLHHDVSIGAHSVIMPGAKITCSYKSPECFKLDTNAVLSQRQINI